MFFCLFYCGKKYPSFSESLKREKIYIIIKYYVNHIEVM